MEKNEKTLAYSSLYFGMSNYEVQTTLKSDEKISNPVADMEAVFGKSIIPQGLGVFYTSTFFDYDYNLDFEYTHRDELCRIVFTNMSIISNQNFEEGITELKKLVSLIEAKYGTPDIKEIGSEIGDYFIAKWNKEKEIMIGIREDTENENLFQVVMVFSYLPLLKEEEEYSRQQESSFIESEIDYF